MFIRKNNSKYTREKNKYIFIVNHYLIDYMPVENDVMAWISECINSGLDDIIDFLSDLKF